MTGLKVLSTISKVVEHVDDSIKIYDTHHQNVPTLPQSLNLARKHLPTLRRTLYLYKADLIAANIKSKPSESCENLHTALEACVMIGWKIRQIFERVLPADDLHWEERYTKCIGILGGPGNTIEDLMFSLTGIVQSVVCDHAVTLKVEQVVELEGIRGDMKSVGDSK